MSQAHDVDRATVYAVVVNYNGGADTIECVESLLASDYRPLRIIVLDNGSSDDSLERIAAWGRAKRDRAALLELSRTEFEADGRNTADARVILVRCGANIGFAAANNIALKHVLSHASSGYALLLNNDATIAPQALRLMMETAQRTPDLGAVGVTVLRRDRPGVVELLGGATVNRVTAMVTPLHAGLARSAPRPEAVRMDYVSGTCLLTSAAALARVGLMDERYFLYSEDVDWGLHMRRAGLRLRYCPEAEVWHKGGASVVHRSALHDYYLVRGALMLVRKHFAYLLPLAMLYWLWRGLLPKLVRGQWARLRAAARGYRDFVLRAPF